MGGGNTLCLAQTTVTTPTIVGPDLGEDYGPQFGHAMAAGDFDNDGKREVAVSTWEMMSSAFPDNDGDGHVYVYEYDSGWSSPTEVSIPYGVPQDCVFFGWTMVAGNVDGDPNDELIIAAPGGEGAGALENGAVYIFDWNSSTSSFDLAYKFRSDPNYGGQQGDNFGWSVALCDFNNDGDKDLVVGARYWSECEENNVCICRQGVQGAVEDWTGSVYVYDHDGWTAASSGWNEVTSADLVIRGEPSWHPTYNPNATQTRSYFGQSVACVGDLNGDGYEDFIVSSPRRTPESFEGGCTGENFYWSADCEEPYTYKQLVDDCRVGKVYLFAGAATYPSTEQDAEAYAKVVFDGEAAEAKLGQALASGGDLNGDGINDIVIASSLYSGTTYSNVGRVYVFLMPDYETNGWPDEEDKHWLASAANVKIDGRQNDNYVLFGYALACNGNTNLGSGEGEDARDDLLVGAPRGNSCDYVNNVLEKDRGYAYLFRFSSGITVGPDGDHLTWDCENACAEYFRLDCGNAYAKMNPHLGEAIAFVGNVDGDLNGNDDIMIGCPGWDESDVFNNEDEDNRGGVYVRFK